MSSTWNQIITQLRSTTSLNMIGAPVHTVIIELLASKSIQSAFYFGEIIKLFDRNQLELTSSQLQTIISQNIGTVTQVTIFTYIYPIMKRQHNNALQWRNAFIKERNQGMFEKFNEWAVSQTPNDNIFKQLLRVLICSLPTILKSQYIEPSQIQFENFLVWLSYFQVNDRQQHESVCKTVKFIKDAKLANTPDYEHKGHLILRRIIQLLGYEQRQKGSLFMLIDPLSIRQKDIQYFFNVYEYLLEDLDELYLCNIFKSLTHSGINKQILFLIQMISHILQNSEQFYTLRYLYHQYILPVLAQKFKTHRKLQKQVFSLVLFYVAGFLAHCKLDESAIQCLIDNIEMLEPQRQLDWAELALIVCKDDLELKQATTKKLATLGIVNASQANMGKIIEKNNRVWKVTLRNGRKLKKYPQIDSVRFKGMTNRCNDCYIISSVQALFITQYFPNLIANIRGTVKKEKIPVVDELYRLFDALKHGQQKKTIASLKGKGPETFRNSNSQQDVQQYLLELFSVIEQQLRLTSQGLSLFQKIFKIQYEGAFICQSCGQTWKKQRSEHTYIYSYRHNEVFGFKTQGKIQGYPCRKCKKENLISQTTIINQPKLLMLHLNRFSHNEGVARKSLGNKPIKRKIGDYRLAGFISHRGAKISAGHYLFYGCIGKGRWAIFDDSRVAEFSVGEQEQFERQFRSENTPYILFYRLEGQKS